MDSQVTTTNVVISRVQFKQVCDCAEQHADELRYKGRRIAAEILSDKCGFPLSESVIPDVEEATGVDMRGRVTSDPGERWKKDRIRPVAMDLIRVMQHLGIDPLPETVAVVEAK